MINKVLCLLLLPIVLMSCDKNKETVYYESGNIRYHVEQDSNGRRSGRMIEYYEDGSIRAESFWKNDSLSGEATHFYKGTDIKMSTSTWNHGLLDGKSKYFFKNGQLKSLSLYKEGKIKSSILYYESGGKMQFQLYNDASEIIYNAYYRMDGTHQFSNPVPLYTPDTDTIKYGKSHRFRIFFGFEMKGNIEVEVNNQLLDEVDKNVFEYEFSPEKLGEIGVRLEFHHDVDLDDTLSVNRLSVTHVFFVEN